jgi:hypothetical protein
LRASPFLLWVRSLKFRWNRFWHHLNGYVKIRYEFSQDDRKEIGFQSETLWSKPLGDNLYQLENIPEFVEDLNLHDVVICQEKSFDFPVITEVFRRSGNRTLRVQFKEETSAENAVDIISNLRQKQVFYEKAGKRRYMFNIEPDANYENVLEFLKSKEQEDLLWVYD